MATKMLVTATELAEMDDDGFRYELIGGELIQMPPAKPDHGWVASNAVHFLRVFCDPRQLGIVLASSVGYQFAEAPDTVLAPDVTFIHRDRVPPLADWREYFRVIPDLVMEVRSPSERKSQIDRKVRLYLAAGVHLVLVADSRKRQLTIYRSGHEPRILRETDEFDAEGVIPGFRLLVADLFAPPAWLPAGRRQSTNGSNGAR